MKNLIQSQRRAKEIARKCFKGFSSTCWIAVEKARRAYLNGPTNCSDDAFFRCFFHIRSSIQLRAHCKRRKKKFKSMTNKFHLGSMKICTLKWDGRKCATLKSLKMKGNEKKRNDMKWNEWKQNKWSRLSIEHTEYGMDNLWHYLNGEEMTTKTHREIGDRMLTKNENVNKKNRKNLVFSLWQRSQNCGNRVYISAG